MLEAEEEGDWFTLGRVLIKLIRFRHCPISVKNNYEKW